MDHSDSDSTDLDSNDYTTTNVLLGFASIEEADDPISQLGGQPVRSTSGNSADLTIEGMA